MYFYFIIICTMDLFKSRLMNRIAIGKSIGFIFWLVAFFLVPLFLTDAGLLLRFGLLFWYTTLWAIIWVFWVWVKHPVCNMSIPFWFRWILIGAWMNFVLALFMYSNLVALMYWYSPFWIMLEWALFWLIVDYVGTKFIWEGKELLN